MQGALILQYITLNFNNAIAVELKAGKISTLKSLCFFMQAKPHQLVVRFNSQKISMLQNSNLLSLLYIWQKSSIDLVAKLYSKINIHYDIK